MALRVFVTREIFPFTAGGIGRVISNILSTSSEEELLATAVLFVGDSIDERAFSAVYPTVRFLSVSDRDYESVDDAGLLYPPKHAFSSTWLYWESVLILQGLRRIEREHGALAYVEFVDWGAAGFAAIQEKRLGRALNGATLAVRLHTTDSVLAAYERRATDVHALTLYDLERKALADCDVIVGQLASVSDAMRLFYGFSESEWNPRVVVHAPPVLLDTLPLARKTVVFGVQTPLVFSSKLQDIKRPDVFVRGCVQFMQENPGYLGEARFLAHAFDQDYQARIKALIPRELEARFVFMRGIAGAARERVIAASVCIFPSPWESFCLAAYEASMSGALCVLNVANPAFGDGTPWKKDQNCLGFDGTAAGLATVLGNAFSDGERAAVEPVSLPCNEAPWRTRRQEKVAPSCLDGVAAVIACQGNALGLLDTLDSLAASSHVPDQVIVVDDGSRDPLSLEVLDRLERTGTPLRVLRVSHPSGSGGAFNAALDCVDAPLVAFLTAGSMVTPDFVEVAAKGMARCADIDLVTGQQAYAASFEEVARRHPHDPAQYWVVHGEARASGHVQNRYVADAFVVRANRARRERFDESLGDRAPWEFLLRCTAAGCRMLVAMNVQVVRRADPAGEAASGRVGWSMPFAFAELMARKQVMVGAMTLPAYAFAPAAGATASVPGTGQDAFEHLYTELRASETVRTALFVADTLQRRAPWLLSALKRGMPLAVRLRRR